MVVSTSISLEYLGIDLHLARRLIGSMAPQGGTRSI